MPDRKPTMDDLDLKLFAVIVAGVGVAVGGAIGIVMWLLPWLLAMVAATATPTAAGVLLLRWVDRWWRNHSEDGRPAVSGEANDA